MLLLRVSEVLAKLFLIEAPLFSWPTNPPLTVLPPEKVTMALQECMAAEEAPTKPPIIVELEPVKAPSATQSWREPPAIREAMQPIYIVLDPVYEKLHE